VFQKDSRNTKIAEMAINPIDPWKTVVQENCINYYYYYYYYYYKIAERYYA